MTMPKTLKFKSKTGIDMMQKIRKWEKLLIKRVAFNFFLESG